MPSTGSADDKAKIKPGQSAVSQKETGSGIVINVRSQDTNYDTIGEQVKTEFRPPLVAIMGKFPNGRSVATTPAIRAIEAHRQQIEIDNAKQEAQYYAEQILYNNASTFKDFSEDDFEDEDDDPND